MMNLLINTVFHDFEFLFVPDFGANATLDSAPVIQDAYLNYRYSPELQLWFAYDQKKLTQSSYHLYGGVDAFPGLFLRQGHQTHERLL